MVSKAAASVNSVVDDSPKISKTLPSASQRSWSGCQENAPIVDAFNESCSLFSLSRMALSASLRTCAN